MTYTDKNSLFVKSEFLQTIKYRDKLFIWHSLFGNLKMATIKVLTLINEFSNPRYLNEILNSETCGEKMITVEELKNFFYLIPYGFDERAFLSDKMIERENKITDGSLIDYLGLIAAEECNFRCSYCIHFSNLKNSERINNSCKIMNFNVAKNAVDNYLSIISWHGKNIAKISFSGGEPLFALALIEKTIKYCLSRYGNKFTFNFSLTTNSSLITSEIACMLKKYQINISSSLDGMREGNDKIRLTNVGKGTFETILSGFKKLREIKYPIQVIGITVNEQNFYFLNEKIIDLIDEYEIRKVYIDIDVLKTVKIPIEIIIQKIIYLRRYAKKLGINISGFWARPAKNAKKSTLDPRGVAFCGAVQGRTICVDPLGNIYGCGYSNTLLGKLDKILSFCEQEGKYHIFTRNHLTGKIKMCEGCIIEGQCGGGCNITQEFIRSTKNLTKINFMCDFYRSMTYEILIEQLRETK